MAKKWPGLGEIPYTTSFPEWPRPAKVRYLIRYLRRLKTTLFWFIFGVFRWLLALVSSLFSPTLAELFPTPLLLSLTLSHLCEANGRDLSARGTQAYETTTKGKGKQLKGRKATQSN